MRPVPVLLTVRELDHGGIERDVAKLAIRLDRSRFEPHVASYHAEGMRFEELRRAGVPVLHLPVSSLVSRSALVAAMRMRRYIRANKIRLVHAWDPTAVFVVPLARMLRVPVVISSQLGHRGLGDGRTRKELRLTDRMVDTVVVNCEAMRRHLIEDEGLPPERIQLCYNGVETGEFYPEQTPKPDPISNASFVIGTVCVLRPEKAVDLLQEAFSLVRHVNPDMKLVIVGNGPELLRLQQNSVLLGIQDSCQFVPATPNVAPLLRAMDIFALCSHSEAFSNSLLEAMACGCCCVGSRVGGTPELIGDDERGLLFRAGDVRDLAEKLSLLMRNEKIRQGFQSRAAAFARDSLNMEINVGRITEIYENLLQAKGVGRECALS